MTYQFDLQAEENRLWLNLKRLFNLHDSMRSVYFEDNDTLLHCVRVMSRQRQSFMINDKLDKLTAQDLKDIKTKSDYLIANTKHSKWSNITVNNELIENKDRSYMFELKDAMIAMLLCELKFIDSFVLYIKDLTIKGEVTEMDLFLHNELQVITHEELHHEFSFDLVHSGFSVFKNNTSATYCAMIVYENCNFVNTLIPFMNNELVIMLNCNVIDTFERICVGAEHAGKILNNRVISFSGYKPYVTLCLYNCTIGSNLLYDRVSKVIILTENKLEEKDLNECRTSMSIPSCLPIFNVLLTRGVPDELPKFAFNNKEDNWCSLDCDICDCD